MDLPTPEQLEGITTALTWVGLEAGVWTAVDGDAAEVPELKQTEVDSYFKVLEKYNGGRSAQRPPRRSS